MVWKPLTRVTCLLGLMAGASVGAASTTDAAATSTPSPAERAASKAACAPFLKAANQPLGHKQWGAPPRMAVSKARHYQVKLYTGQGAITVTMLTSTAPITTNNFIFLSCNGFYDGVIFHRIIPGFVIQGGDPTGTGTGGPGYQFPDERVPRPYQIGDMAMANAGPNTNGSQFFIIQGPQGGSLPTQYSLFGHVTTGEGVVDAIANAPAHVAAGGGDSSPSAPDHPVHILVVTIKVS